MKSLITLFFFRSASTARNWMLLGILIYAAFGMLDALYYEPSNLKTALLVRFGITIPLLTGCYLATFHPKLKIYFLWIMAIFVVVAVLGINGLIAVSNPTDQAYDFWFVGLLLVMFWTHNSGIYSWMVISIYFVTLLTYNITAIVFQQLHVHSPAALVVNNCILATAILVSYISHCIIESFIAQDQEIKKELRDAAALKEQILSVISHDVRGPVASIMGLLRLSAKGFITSSELKNNSESLLSSVESLQSLLDTIFIWTMDHKDNFPLEKAPLNVRDVVTGVLKVFNPYVKKKSIDLYNNVDDHVAVVADPTMLNIILRGIVSNAFKFTSSSSITFSANQTPEQTLIYIQYWGPGSDRQIQNLTGKGVAPVHSSDGRSGFGLQICKDLVEKRHRGTFKVDASEVAGTIICCGFPNSGLPSANRKVVRQKEQSLYAFQTNNRTYDQQTNESGLSAEPL